MNADKAKIMLFRNRSVIEACIVDGNTGEVIRDRIPVEWRARENKLDYLSVSKIQAYEQCPANFYHQFLSEDSASEDSGNFFTKFGSILHGVVEMAHKYYRDNGIIVDPVAIYDEEWKAHDLVDFPAYIEGKKLIQDYFRRNPVDKNPYTTVFIEEEWRGELGGCTFGLIIDKAEILTSDPTIGRLSDYKTNRMPFTPNELETSFQLRVYELVLRRFLLPDVKKWIAGYEMFRFGWQQCPEWTEDDLLDAEQYISDVNHQILNDNKWEEKLNNFCGYRNCRFTCKRYQEYITNPKRFTDAFGIEGCDMEEIERQRELMATYEKVAKTRKEEAANIIKKAIQDAAMKGESLVINGEEMQLYSNHTQSYNYYDTRAILLEQNQLGLLDGCLSISKAKLDSVLKGHPDLKLQLAGAMTTNYASPYIVKKKPSKSGK